MKMSHKRRAPVAGPVWGLAFGVLMMAASAALWWLGSNLGQGLPAESLAVAALLVGVFTFVCAAREIARNRR